MGRPLIYSLLALLFLTGLSSSVHAAELPKVVITQVVVGFGGTYKVGEWAPIQVTVDVENSADSQPFSAALVVECPDPDENLVQIPSALEELPAGKQRTLHGVFKTGRQRGDFHIRVITGGEHPATLAETRLRNGEPTSRIPWTWKPPLRLNQQIWATLGRPSGFDQLPTDESEIPPQVVPLTAVAELPGSPFALKALDVVVIAVTPELLQEISLRQDDALRDWVLGGGHLFVALGGNSIVASDNGRFAPPFVKPRDKQKLLPIATWAPLELTGKSDLRQLTGLEAITSHSTPIKFTGAVQTARFGDVQGHVLATGPFGPLLVRVPFGFGKITCLGVDLNGEQLSTWKPLPWLCKKIVGVRREGPQRNTQGKLAAAGFSDLATQLHAAQEHFPSVRRVSYWQMMGLIGLLILVLGPLDYFIVSRWLKRPVWTWYTLPALSALCVLAAFSVSAWLNGQQTLVNQFDLVDLDVATGTLRGQSWIALYSPESQRYDVEVVPAADDWLFLGSIRSAGTRRGPSVSETLRLSWSAPPEETIGGLYRSGGLNVASRGYQLQGARGEVANLPVSQWSTKSLTSEWTRPAADLFDNRLERSASGRLMGSLSHRLPCPLENCLLVYGAHVFFPPGQGKTAEEGPQFASGGTWRPANSRGLKALLTGAVTRTIQGKVATEYVTSEEKYDPFSRDRDKLVRMLTFHNEADGSRHTELMHAALGRVELSDLVGLDRAVLLGRIESPVVGLKINNREFVPGERTTYFRVVLPVAASTVAEDDGNTQRFGAPEVINP